MSWASISIARRPNGPDCLNMMPETKSSAFLRRTSVIVTDIEQVDTLYGDEGLWTTQVSYPNAEVVPAYPVLAYDVNF